MCPARYNPGIDFTSSVDPSSRGSIASYSMAYPGRIISAASKPGTDATMATCTSTGILVDMPLTYTSLVSRPSGSCRSTGRVGTPRRTSGPDTGRGTAGRGPCVRGSPRRHRRPDGRAHRAWSPVPPNHDLTLGKDLAVERDEHEMGALAFVFFVSHEQRYLARARRLLRLLSDARGRLRR